MPKRSQPVDRVEVLRILAAHYEPVEYMERNEELEEQLIRRSKVELALLARLQALKLDLWAGKLIELRQPDSTAEVRCHAPLRGHLVQGRTECYLATMLLHRGGCQGRGSLAPEHYSLGALGALCRDSQNLLPLAYPLGETSDRIVNETRSLPDLLSDNHDRLCLKPDPEKRGLGAASPTMLDGGPVGTRLVYLYCLLHGYRREAQGVDQLATVLGLDRRRFHFAQWLDGRTNWVQCVAMVPPPDDSVAGEGSQSSARHSPGESAGLGVPGCRIRTEGREPTPIPAGHSTPVPDTHFVLAKPSNNWTTATPVTGPVEGPVSGADKLTAPPQADSQSVRRPNGWPEVVGSKFVPAFLDGSAMPSDIIQIDSRNKAILPITAWTYEGVGFRYYLNLPARRPGLTGLDRLQGHPDAQVLLTDSVERAWASRNRGEEREAVWVSWYGEEEAVRRIDWECLKGRDVLYVLQQRPNCTREAAFRTAFAVCQKLDGRRGTRVTVVEIAPNLGDSRVWSAGEFCAECRQWLHVDAAPPPTNRFAPVSMEQIAASAPPKRTFLLEPFLAEKSTTLIFSRTNLGKTWMAIALGTALAHGSAVFGRWQAPRPRKVLYIDSEMDIVSMRTRVATVSRMVFDGRKLPRKHRGNFHIVSRSRSGGDTDVFKDECLAFVRKVGISLVILDNITAFTQHNDSAKAWEDIHVWIDALKESNCAAVLIHHENRAGQQRGTSATTNAVDNVLHLVDPEPEELDALPGEEDEAGEVLAMRLLVKKGKVLAMKVLVEKGRDIHGTTRMSFLILMRPSAEPPTCNGHALKLEDDDSCKEVEHKSPGLPRGRGSRRSKGRAGEIMQRMLKAIGEGSTLREAAAEGRVSESWLRNRLNREGDTAMIEELERALATGKGKRQSESREVQEWIANNVGELGYRGAARRRDLSESKARRLHDDYWTERIREEIPEEERQADNVMARFNLDRKIAERLLGSIKLERAFPLRFGDPAMSYEEIAEELGVPVGQVATLCRAGEKRRRGVQDRLCALLKVRELYEGKASEVDIIAEVDLPPKTIRAALNKLACSVEEFERMLPVIEASEN